MNIPRHGGSLRERFEDFISTFEGYESIDELLKTTSPSGKARADYLLADRSIIVEQKTLEIDPADRPQKFLQKLTRERGIVFWGTIGSNVLFSKMFDGERQRERMFKHLTEPLQQIVRTADKQTADTREIFNIPDATGVVVLLNKGANTLTPDIVRWGLSRAIADGPYATELKYSANTGFILLSEIHSAISQDGTTLKPILRFVHPNGANQDAFDAFSNLFTERWAAFNRAPLHSVTYEELFRAK